LQKNLFPLKIIYANKTNKNREKTENLFERQEKYIKINEKNCEEGNGKEGGERRRGEEMERRSEISGRGKE